MNCPACGAANPDDAEYCYLCMQRMSLSEEPVMEEKPLGLEQKLPARATGEWRGEDELLLPAPSEALRKKVKKHRLKIIIYGIVILALILWLVLSLTVWGTVSPGERAKRLIKAINDRSLESFCSNFLPQERTEGERLYNQTLLYLGSDGSYKDVRFKVEQSDAYTAKAYAKEGAVQGVHGSEALDADNRISIVMENHNGVWYVSAVDTTLIP